MSVRIGVDVGGTFTKAVACDAQTGTIVARCVVPTSHTASLGVATGVAQAIQGVTEDVLAAGLGPVGLVAHSTTQAVNALLEGDAAAVGVLGIGRRPDLKRSRKRTQVGSIKLAPGRSLTTLHRFLDATDGLTGRAIDDALDDLVADGARAICVSEAFGVDDAGAELQALEAARTRGLPACGGHELSGLYGLEMRTVTGALNASILPTALRTARVVERSVHDVPLLVMRGDGGAAELSSMVRHPLVTAFSGPAASVAGALRYLALGDGVVVEVGGTSTNISCIKGGRPVLAYVRVLDHVTCVRSIDVRVVGVAGGSLIRVESRFGRPRVAGVGPRSAHIAGLPYCSFASENELVKARIQLVAPRAGDPPQYAVVETSNGNRFALTPTCAANALGSVPSGAYAFGSGRAARAGFEALGQLLGTTWDRAASAVVRSAAASIADVVRAASHEFDLEVPEIIGLGGGAGALVPALAGEIGSAWRIPRDAEVISSVGDALSLIRVERERSMSSPTAQDIHSLHREAEDAAIEAGASPVSVRVESCALPERRAVRAVATGSIALETNAVPEEHEASHESILLAAKRELGEDPALVAGTAFYSVFSGSESDWVVVDRHASLVLSGRGAVLAGSGGDVAARLPDAIRSHVRSFGPLAVAPAVRVLRGSRLIDLSLLSSAEAAIDAALAECNLANGDGVVAFLSRT